MIPGLGSVWGQEYQVSDLNILMCLVSGVAFQHLAGYRLGNMGLLLKLEKCRFIKREKMGSPEKQGEFPGRFHDSGTRIELQQRCEESENILREFLLMRTLPPIVEA